MKQDAIKCIHAFCKQTVTVGKPVSFLHRKFISFPSYPVITLDQFIHYLQIMKKKVIKDLEKECLKYIELHGIDSYSKFLKEKEFITETFWKSVIEKIKKTEKIKEDCSEKISKSCESLLPEIIVQEPTTTHDPVIEKSAKKEPAKNIVPSNWNSLQQREKVEYVSKLSDLNVLEAIYKKFQNSEVANEAAMRADEIMAEQKKSPTFRELFPSVEPKPKIPKKIVEQKIDYKSQLPVDWNKMTRSERIDFVKKIQHKGFYAYVLSLDNDLAEYIKSTKKNVSKQSLSLYVNLFSFPSKSASDESKALLKSFVESLNMLGRARLEYVELVDPPVVEVREVRR